MRKGNQNPSPCLSCTRVKDPRNCDNKLCQPWRQWFLRRWDMIHRYPREQMDKGQRKPVGVPLGGRHYAAPHQVEAYRNNDPCKTCLCPKDLCTTPCRHKRAWEQAKGDVFL